MGTAWLVRPLLARPDDDCGASPPPLREFSLSARDIVLNDPGLLRDHILAFVPPDTFRLVAPVSHIFHRQYLAAHHHHNSTRTLLRHAVATPRTVQLWLDDGRLVLPLAVMAARWGRLDVLQWCLHNSEGWPLLTPDPDAGHEIGVAAASGGHLHVIEWALLTNELVRWYDVMSNAAARNGHLHVLRFAQARGYPMSGQELRLSAANGHLNAVIWCRQNDYPWDNYTCAEAAHGGHLPVLQWLRTNECPWDKWTCFWASISGQLHILQWAIANGCPWNVDDCLENAAAFHHTDIVEWIHGNGWVVVRNMGNL
jgi:hypothetical protein